MMKALFSKKESTPTIQELQETILQMQGQMLEMQGQMLEMQKRLVPVYQKLLLPSDEQLKTATYPADAVVLHTPTPTREDKRSHEDEPSHKATRLNLSLENIDGIVTKGEMVKHSQVMVGCVRSLVDALKEDMIQELKAKQEEVGRGLPVQGILTVSSPPEDKAKSHIIFAQFIQSITVQQTDDSAVTKEDISKYLQRMVEGLDVFAGALREELRGELKVTQQFNQKQNLVVLETLLEYILHTNLHQCYDAATARALLQRLTSPEKIKVLEISEKILEELNTQAAGDNQERSEVLKEYLLSTALLEQGPPALLEQDLDPALLEQGLQQPVIGLDGVPYDA